MSFQGIRKIRDNRKGSPILLQSTDPGSNSPTIKQKQFTFDLKLSNTSDVQTARDSQTKVSPTTKCTRKSSLRVTSPSKDKQKKILIGNFMNINLEGLKAIRPSRELKRDFLEAPTTDRIDRVYANKSSTDEIQREDIRLISVNSFVLDFVVGKGGFGKVWKVCEKSTNKIYAMKDMQKVKIISKKSVHSVMNEKQLLQKLKHPFLVNMVYSFQNRENLYLVMDYCNRGDMRYHLGNVRKFKEEQTRFFLACIVLCLEYLHGKKVIHRDLKPENLVLDNRGYLRVTDLGVSRQVKPNNAEDTSGTPGYMSPEVICKMNHSYPTDFFALGVIGYEFITGKRPYVGANRKEIREKILAKQVQLDQIPPFGWSRESIDFVNRLIQRKPDNRLGTAGIQQVKFHPFFKKVDWQKLQQRKLNSPFLPQTIQEDYSNYKQCISEDTEIEDIEEYRMILRHKDTQEAFIGYDYNNILSPIIKRKSERKDFDPFIHTTIGLRKRK